jgi:plasmid stability protein
MATLTVRNLDDALIARLKDCASQHGRSLESEIREVLASYAARPTNAEMKRMAERVAASTDPSVQTDSVELLREDRWR